MAARPPFRSAYVLLNRTTPSDPPGFWAVLENRWGGAVMSRHASQEEAQAEAGRLNATPALPAAVAPCAALFCGPPCPDHSGPGEPAPADPELDALMDAETAMEEYRAKLRADPKERAAARKVYRDAFKAAGEDPKEAARKAAALVDMDREGF